MEEATLIFSMHLPVAHVPRVVAFVDELRDQGFIVSATLTRDASMAVCPLCDRPMRRLEDLHQHAR